MNRTDFLRTLILAPLAALLAPIRRKRISVPPAWEDTFKVALFTSAPIANNDTDSESVLEIEEQTALRLLDVEYDILATMRRQNLATGRILKRLERPDA